LEKYVPYFKHISGCSVNISISIFFFMGFMGFFFRIFCGYLFLFFDLGLEEQHGQDLAAGDDDE